LFSVQAVEEKTGQAKNAGEMFSVVLLMYPCTAVEHWISMCSQNYELRVENNGFR
jgi:hypothetical protein